MQVDPPPSLQELEQLFLDKHGDITQAGWTVQRRHRFRYYQPDDWYEAVVARHVREGTRWLDVGGGSSVFPYNPNLARRLSERCEFLAGVDPSPNIHDNPYVRERAQCLIEDYNTEHRFDLITMRMVAEHITDPARVLTKLHSLLSPGGRVVIYTVNIRTPIALVARIVPFRFHHPIKRLFWGGEEKDTFPTAYKMNTRKSLRALFEQIGLRELLFLYLDDCSTFGMTPGLNWLELASWQLVHGLGMTYPENCLLGVYGSPQVTRELRPQVPTGAHA